MSIGFGIAGLLAPWRVVNGIALQALIWGSVDATIAVVAWVGARRRSLRYPDETREVEETIRLRRTLRINGFLDIVYIATGAAIVVVFQGQPFALGNGVGVIIQGAFLLVFDFVHAFRLPAEPPAWYSGRR
jgi:hypothetical protein